MTIEKRQFKAGSIKIKENISKVDVKRAETEAIYDTSQSASVTEQIANFDTSPTSNTFNNMLNEIGSASMIQSTNPLESVQQKNPIFFQGSNDPSKLNTSAGGTSYPYHEYYKHIHGFSQLFDPNIARQYAHTFFVETLFMLCDNVTNEQSFEEIIHYVKTTTNCDSSKLPKKGKYNYTGENILPQQVEKKYENFSIGLIADVTAQHEVNMTLQGIDFKTRQSYLEDQLEVITKMTGQQNILIDSLTHWSNYLDEQAQEYAHLHETISTKMTTFKRKDVFDIQESNSLEIWNKWSTIIFWVLVIIFVLMLVVQHYRSLSNMASQAEQQFKDTASKAYDAITQVQ